MHYPSAVNVEMVIQPALEVRFYFLEGDMLYYGSRGTVQIELKDRSGELFNPTGDIMMSVFAVDDLGLITEPAAIFGTADQESLESIPQCGRFVFEFDSSLLPDSSPRALVRASIPYHGTQVIWQRTVQLQSIESLT